MHACMYGFPKRQEGKKEGKKERKEKETRQKSASLLQLARAAISNSLKQPAHNSFYAVG